MRLDFEKYRIFRWPLSYVMNLRLKITFLLISAFLLIQPCLAQDLASTYKPKSETERLAIAKIRNLPEVMGFFDYVKKDKADFIINPPSPTYNNCYAIQVGVNYNDSFRTYFWLLINPKTFKIFFEDFDDTGMETITLQQWRYWRKRPEFKKPHKWVGGKLVVVKTEPRRAK